MTAEQKAARTAAVVDQLKAACDELAALTYTPGADPAAVRRTAGAMVVAAMLAASDTRFERVAIAYGEGLDTADGG